MVSSPKLQGAPVHGAVWLQHLFDVLKARGFSRSQIVGNTGIDDKAVMTDPDLKLPFDQIAAVFERAAEITGDDLFGARLGQTRDETRAGLLAYVGLSAPTLADCLHNLARYQRVFSDAIEMDASQLEESGVITWRYRVPFEVRRRQFLEFSAVGMISSLRRATARDLQPEAVRFVHMRTDGQDELIRYFGGAVSFGAEINAMTFQTDHLTLPLRSSDDRLFGLLRDYAERILSEHGDEATTLQLRVEREIAAQLTQGTPRQADVAKALGMSGRTLARKLSAEGVSFGELLNRYRMALAEAYLSDGELSVTEIAYLLGYGDTSAFSTAYRRWTGTSPSTVQGKGRAAR